MFSVRILIAFINNLRTILAGYNETGVSSCERYDVQKDIWKEITNMGKPQYKLGTAIGSGDIIYLLGGKLQVLFDFERDRNIRMEQGRI